MGTKNCPACKTSNPTKARFCFSCGEAFNILCTDCGEENPGKSKFCMSCGSSLKGAPKKEKINAPTKKQKANSSSKSPKKSDKVQIVSVLFADIKGFTSISEKLKPDQVKFLMDHILKELTLCIEAEDGYVDKYIGDAIMAIFGGYKPTKEDAENAIRSAINMQKKIDELSNIFMKKGRIDIKLRVGINSGKVVLGALGKGREKDLTAMGDTVNLAQRLETACEPGKILISHSTKQLAIGKFSFWPKNPIKVKGKSTAINSFEILNDIPFDFSAAPEFNGKEIPVFGREKEIEVLQSTLKTCFSNKKSAAVLLLGDPGIGKSTLAYKINLFIEDLEERVFYFSASPFFKNDTYSDSFFESLIRNRFGIRQGEDREESLVKLREGLKKLLFPGEKRDEYKVNKAEKIFYEMEVFLARILGIGHENNSFLDGYSASDGSLREKTVNLIIELLGYLSHHQPVVLVCDNAHLMTKNTFETLINIQNILAENPICSIFLAQPQIPEEYLKVFETKERLQLLKVQPLETVSIQKMLKEILRPLKNAKDFPYNEIAEKALGNPYFLLETCRLLIDENVTKPLKNGYKFDKKAFKKVNIPNSVNLIIQSRINGLSANAQVLLGRAAVIGETFWQQILLGSEDKKYFDELVLKELIIAKAFSQIPFDKEFYFCSKVVHEVCLESITEKDKRTIHQEIADWLSSFSESHSLELKVLFANHQRGAGNIRESFVTLINAAQRAFQMGSFAFAANLYEEADNLRMDSDLLDLFDNEELRIADLKTRFAYKENYITSIKMGLGNTDKVVDLCRNYINILKTAVPRKGQSKKQFDELKKESLRVFWSEIISQNSQSFNDEENSQINLLLKNISQAPLTEGEIRLWSSLIIKFSYSLDFTKPFKEKLFALLQNMKEILSAGGMNSPRARFELFYGLCVYQFMVSQNYNIAIKNAGRAITVAFKYLGKKDQIKALNILGACLAESGDFAFAAQIFAQIREIQSKMNTHYENYVHFSNEAECYLRLGHFKTALSFYKKAMDIIESQGLSATNQTDPFSNFAIIKLNLSPHKVVDEYLNKIEVWAKKGPLFYHRWLRAKALSYWIIHKDFESAEACIENAKMVESSYKVDHIITEMVWLQILRASKKSYYRDEVKRVEAWVAKNREIIVFWKNFLDTRTSLPKAQHHYLDHPLHNLDKKELLAKLPNQIPEL